MMKAFHVRNKKKKNVEKSFVKQLHLMFITQVNTHSHTLILFYLFSAMFKGKKKLFLWMQWGKGVADFNCFFRKDFCYEKTLGGISCIFR